MIANLLVIVFLIAMAYWWGLQGFFSAFIHLIATIAAGAIAFALWEPLVHGFLFNRMPEYAWGVGLIAPFILAMVLLRLPLDFLIKKNVHFHQVINLIAGGFCGLLAGVLTGGLGLIALSYLPLGIAVGGYQPLGIDPSGKVVEVGGLWVPVDRQAAGFFAMLSGGSFNAGAPLAEHRPELPDQAATFRLQRHYDPNAALVATPPSVKVTAAASHKSPPPGLDGLTQDALGADAKRPGHTVVAIETQWQATPGVFDQGTLYLSPVQIRLATREGEFGNPATQLHPPVAFSRRLSTGRTQLTSVVPAPGQASRTVSGDTPDRIMAKSSDQQQTITWVFVIPAAQQPQHLFARQLRLPLPDAADWTSESDKIVAMLGQAVAPPPPDTPDGTQPDGGQTGEIGPREGIRAGNMPVQIEATDRLPDMVSKNFMQGMNTRDDAVISGNKDVPKPTGSTSAALRVDRVWRPDHQRVVRVQIARDQATSLYGASRAAAASLQQPLIEDNQGQTWQAIGYVWHKADGTQQININRDAPIQSARQLPIGEMAPDDELYLYFVVNANTRITRYHVGSSTSFDTDVPVP